MQEIVVELSGSEGLSFSFVLSLDLWYKVYRKSRFFFHKASIHIKGLKVIRVSYIENLAERSGRAV